MTDKPIALAGEPVAWQETDVYWTPLWDESSFSKNPDSFAYKRALYAANAEPSVLTDAALEAWFVKQGDDKGQGLHPYYKSAVRDGFSLAIAILRANGATK